MRPDGARYRYIDTAGGLETLGRKIAAAGRVAVDTEADSLHSYFEKVCLIQLTAEGENFVLDPLAGLELTGFFRLLAEKNLIFHGGDYDLRMLASGFGFRPRGEVFDTGIAARLLGYRKLGLAALAEELLGVVLGKGGQKFNWARRPLPEEKIVYAVNDTRYLEPLADILLDRLRESGREEWARESCRALVRETGRPKPDPDPDRVWRIKGLKDLSREELALVRALWHWREEEARRADIPPFKVLGNQPLIALALWLRRHPDLPVTRGPKLPRTCRGERLRKLSAAVAAARQLPPGRRPFHPERKPPPPRVPGENERYQLLRERVAETARRLGLPASVVAPQAALRAIARENPAGIAGMMEAGGLTSWQARLVAEGASWENRQPPEAVFRCRSDGGCL